MHEQNRLLRNEMKEPDLNEILFEQNNANSNSILIDYNDQSGNALNVGEPTPLEKVIIVIIIPVQLMDVLNMI